MTSKRRVKRTWNVYKGTANAGSGVDLEFFWNAAEESTSPALLNQPNLYHYNEATWLWDKHDAPGATSYPSATSLKYVGYTGSFSPFAIGGESGVDLLPVTWLNFECKRLAPRQVLIKFSTGSEENTDAFHIQRKIGNGDFETIGILKSAGFTLEPRHYEFTDETAPRTSVFYRVKQTDLDGKFTYTDVCMSSEVGANDDNGIFVAPNPANDELTVSINETDAEYSCHLYDATGKLVLSGSAVSGRCLLNTTTLYPGVYLLKVEGAGITASRKVVIQH
jgi:hypothetical protein